MTLFGSWWQSKNEPKKEEINPRSKEDHIHTFIDGFSSGFELGMKMASTFDQKIKDRLKQDAIEEALGRLHGNHKTPR